MTLLKLDYYIGMSFNNIINIISMKIVIVEYSQLFFLFFNYSSETTFYVSSFHTGTHSKNVR